MKQSFFIRFSPLAVSVLALLGAFALATTAGGADVPESAQPAKATLPEPTDAYDVRDVEGWRVRVNKRFAAEDPAACNAALDLLRFQLYQVVRVVPPAAVGELKKVTIWLEQNEPHHPCMAYHPDPGWLRAHDMNPDKARCVEIANAERFMDWTKDQPWMVLHELAHAYHHQFLPDGFGNPDLRAAFRRATVEEKRYDAVQHINGRTERGYAAVDPMEFFAEGTEALFGTNDFYPFVRSELKTHDPETHALLRKLWGVGK